MACFSSSAQWSSRSSFQVSKTIPISPNILLWTFSNIKHSWKNFTVNTCIACHLGSAINSLLYLLYHKSMHLPIRQLILFVVRIRVSCKHYYSSAINKTIGFWLLSSEFLPDWAVSAHLGRREIKEKPLALSMRALSSQSLIPRHWLFNYSDDKSVHLSS